jgi:AraC-like DNA-binding protein
MQIDLHRLWLQRGSESLPRIINGPVSSDRVAIEFPIGTHQPAIRHRGINVAPGEIVVHDTEPVARRSFAPSHWGSMSLTPADLAAAGRVLVGRELTRPSVMHVVRPPPVVLATLMKFHAEAALLAKTAPARLAHPRVARSLEDALIRAMIRCLTKGTPAEVDSRAPHRTNVISKLEEFLVANCIRPIYLSEICIAADVSESTLRRCCHEHLGMGPVRYLWLRRMHLARIVLMRADPATATVTGIATDYGFWELGRFSVDYRTLFGELPSATLRRSPVDARLAQNRPFDLPTTDFA